MACRRSPTRTRRASSRAAAACRSTPPSSSRRSRSAARCFHPAAGSAPEAKAMSTTATESASTASPGADTDPKPPRPWLRVAVAVAAVIVVGVVVLAVIDPFGGGATSSGARQGAYPTSTATVRQGPVSAYADAAGTLGYAAQPDGSPYAVVNRARGVYTALPAPGQVIRQGQPLYEVGYRPVVLLDASAPAARSLSQGDSGPDVHQLNADLVALGYAKRSQLSPSSDV